MFKGEGKREKALGADTVDQDTYCSRRVRSWGEESEEAVGCTEEFS